MEKYLVNYNQALALKELGFNEKCYGYFTKHEEFFYFDVDDLSSAYTKNMDNLVVNSVDELECTAPLKSQVFEWFKNKHHLTSWIEPMFTNQSKGDPTFKIVAFEDNYIYYDKYFETLAGRGFNGYFKTTEEAKSAAIDKLITLIK